VWALIWIVSPTWRFEVIAEDGVTPVLFGEKPGPEIYCFWHQCVLPCTVYFRRSHAVILISQSFDGELITRILKLFGFDAVRGSSSRGAREGLLGLARIIETGRTAIFTADGPLGPIYQPKWAHQAGAENRRAHRRLSSATRARMGHSRLDRFLVPKPFTRICVSWAQWTRVPSDLAPEDFEPSARS